MSSEIQRMASTAFEEFGFKIKKVPKNATEAYKFTIEEYFEVWHENISDIVFEQRVSIFAIQNVDSQDNEEGDYVNLLGERLV